MRLGRHLWSRLRRRRSRRRADEDPHLTVEEVLSQIGVEAEAIVHSNNPGEGRRPDAGEPELPARR